MLLLESKCAVSFPCAISDNPPVNATDYAKYSIVADSFGPEYSSFYDDEYTDTYSDPEFAQKRLATKMIPLYKQILSDRETKSFILESYSNDSQVQGSVKEFFESQILNCDIAGRKVNVLNELISLIKRIAEFDLGSIYVNQDELSNISLELFKSWNTINAILFKNAERRIGSAEKAANKKVFINLLTW